MPLRTIPLRIGQYYHIFNRSINKEPIFTKVRDCERAISTIKYYRFTETILRLAYFLKLGPDRRSEILNNLNKNSTSYIDILCFCLMPNHFHFLLKQNAENGISKFLSLFQNSYTKYFNTKHSRTGHLFQGQFKAVRIEDDEQLLHVQRYIHLNPYSSFVTKTLRDLENYTYSSLLEYLGNSKNDICKKETVFSHFKTPKGYKKFIFDQAEYQRKLDVIKHLILE